MSKPHDVVALDQAKNLHYHQHDGEFADCTRSECVAAREEDDG